MYISSLFTVVVFLVLGTVNVFARELMEDSSLLCQAETVALLLQHANITDLCPSYPVSCDGVDNEVFKTKCIEVAGGQFFTFQAKIKCTGADGPNVNQVIPGCVAQSCTTDMLNDLQNNVKKQITDLIEGEYGGTCDVDASPKDVTGVKPGASSGTFSRAPTVAATVLCLVSGIVGFMV